MRMGRLNWESVFVGAVIGILISLAGCKTKALVGSHTLQRLCSYGLPSIEVVETDYTGEPPAEPLRGLKSGCWIVIRICDLETYPARYEDLYAAHFDEVPMFRLYVLDAEGRPIQIKPHTRQASALSSCLKKIEANPLTRYGFVAREMRDWLSGGSADRLFAALDRALLDYNEFRSKLRELIYDEEIYKWAKRFRVPSYTIDALPLSEAILRLNDVIKEETGHSDIIRYERGEIEPTVRLNLIKIPLADLLKVMILLPGVKQTGAWVVYENGRIIIKHGWIDIHCCPRDW